MAIIYLEPQDVAPAHARQVLDFLNRAETPEEIASAVEIAEERDVGLRVAQRLLDRRRQLGGFTDLAQVAAVPQVGPERFTEIVLTLSDARLPQITPTGGLAGELRELRAMVERLQAAAEKPRQVSLRALQAQPFLGQPVNLVATVMEGNRPVIDAPVTLIAGWGRLRAAVADAPREGPAVTLRTGADGSARALLLPPTSEPLLPVQQDALVAALNHLDPAAATPRAAVSGLQALARLYRHEGNVALRRAVDIYFRDFGRQEALNAADPLAVWGRLETAVTAAAPEPGGSTVQGGAVLALRIRDWLGAWLATYRGLIESEGRLAERLKQVQARGEEADVLLNRAVRRVRTFVEDQQGLAGEAIGRRVAESSLRAFMDTVLESLPEDNRGAVFAQLRVAAGTVVSTGPTVLTAVGRNRQEIGQRFDRVRTELVAPLQADVAQFETRLDDKVDASVFTTFRTQVNQRLDLKADIAAVTALDTRISALQTATNRLDADIGGLRTTVNRLDNDLIRLRPGPGPIRGG